MVSFIPPQCPTSLVLMPWSLETNSGLSNMTSNISTVTNWQSIAFSSQLTLYRMSLIPEPDFVNALQDDKHVFFFFRESAVEYINCGKVCLKQIIMFDAFLWQINFMGHLSYFIFTICSKNMRPFDLHSD